MTDTSKPQLKDFLIQYATEHPESKSGKGAAKQMYLAARARGYDCTQVAINNMRYQYGLGKRYEKMSKAAKIRSATVRRANKRGGRRVKYASPAAAAAAKQAMKRVRRQMAREQMTRELAVVKKGVGPVDKHEPEQAPASGRVSVSERGFLDAVALVGLERAEGLMARFKKQART